MEITSHISKVSWASDSDRWWCVWST